MKLTSSKDGRYRKRLPRLVSLLLVLGLVAASCGGSDSEESSASAETDAGADDGGSSSALPQLTAATVGGGQLEFGSLEGQDAVLWFWAPW